MPIPSIHPLFEGSRLDTTNRDLERITERLSTYRGRVNLSNKDLARLEKQIKKLPESLKLKASLDLSLTEGKCAIDRICERMTNRKERVLFYTSVAISVAGLLTNGSGLVLKAVGEGYPKESDARLTINEVSSWTSRAGLLASIIGIGGTIAGRANNFYPQLEYQDFLRSCVGDWSPIANFPGLPADKISNVFDPCSERFVGQIEDRFEKIVKQAVAVLEQIVHNISDAHCDHKIEQFRSRISLQFQDEATRIEFINLIKKQYIECDGDVQLTLDKLFTHFLEFRNFSYDNDLMTLDHKEIRAYYDLMLIGTHVVKRPDIFSFDLVETFFRSIVELRKNPMTSQMIERLDNLSTRFMEQGITDAEYARLHGLWQWRHADIERLKTMRSYAKALTMPEGHGGIGILGINQSGYSRSIFVDPDMRV